MAALENHKPDAEGGIHRVDELVNKPLSEIDVITYNDQLEAEKKIASVVDVDVKDAKRRISAAKGPRKSKKNKQQNAADDSDLEDEESVA